MQRGEQNAVSLKSGSPSGMVCFQPGLTTFPSSSMPALCVIGAVVYVSCKPDASGIDTGVPKHN
jgi:hypothetical protein